MIEITYTERHWQEDGLAAKQGPFAEPLGKLLFANAKSFYGILPPYTLLRKNLQKGRLLGCDGVLYEWQPFRLSRLDYDQLKADLKANPQWGGEVIEGYKGSRVYWDRWAILKAATRLAA